MFRLYQHSLAQFMLFKACTLITFNTRQSFKNFDVEEYPNKLDKKVSPFTGSFLHKNIHRTDYYSSFKMVKSKKGNEAMDNE